MLLKIFLGLGIFLAFLFFFLFKETLIRNIILRDVWYILGCKRWDIFCPILLTKLMWVVFKVTKGNGEYEPFP